MDPLLGGDAALARLRTRLNLRGMRLMVDFVGNHLAVDHDWVSKKPHLFVQGNEEELAAEPANFFKAGGVVVAHGRDQMFDGWEDTAQVGPTNLNIPALQISISPLYKPRSPHAALLLNPAVDG